MGGVELKRPPRTGAARGPRARALGTGGPGTVGPRTLAVVVNRARVPDPAALERQVRAALARDGWATPVFLETTREDPGLGAARRAVASGAAAVLVCGGDGTVGAVAAGLAGTGTALAILPCGSGNVLARNLRLPRDGAGAVRTVTRGQRRRIDVGEVEGRVFTVAAGIGLDAAMVAVASPRAKRVLGWLAYVPATLRHLGGPRFAIALRLDGAETVRRRVRSVLVANVGRLPGGLALVPGGSLDDGRLDVVCIEARGPADWARLLLAAATGRTRRTGAETFSARRVVCIADGPRPREVDGEPIAAGRRLAASVRPGALVVCVPRPAGDRGDAGQPAGVFAGDRMPDHP